MQVFRWACLAAGMLFPTAGFSAPPDSGVFCSKDGRSTFVGRVRKSGDMSFAVAAANARDNIISVDGVAKPHKGGWRYQVTSVSDPDARCTIDIVASGGGFVLRTVEGARCVNAGGYGAYTALIELRFPASSYRRPVTTELDSGSSLMENDYCGG